MKTVPEKTLLRIAQLQSGYFNTQQATAAGYGRYLMTYHTKNGHWLRVDRAVYRLPGFAENSDSRLARAFLQVGTRMRGGNIAVSHESALWYYRLQDTLPEAVHLTIPEMRRNLTVEGCILHRAALGRTQMQSGAGFLLTTPLRTLCDMKPDLVYQCRWSATVRQALEWKLIREEEGRNLLGGDESLAQTARSEHVLQDAGTGGEGMVMLTRQMRSVRREWGLPARTFTMVEMLIVIAVILILSALLMPALQSARISAYTASCTSNLRQAGLGCAGYADTYRGYNPPFVGLPTDSPSVAGAMYGVAYWMAFVGKQIYPGYTTCDLRYGGTALVLPDWCLRCPSSVQTDRVYTINGEAHNDATQRGGFNSPGLIYGYTMMRNAWIKAPSRRYAISDGTVSYARYGSFTSWIDATGTGGNFYEASRRHNENLNVLYADGHVNTLNYFLFPSPGGGYARPLHPSDGEFWGYPNN